MSKKLPPIPSRIKTLKWDARGYPIPWFVGYDEDGVADFRTHDGEKLRRAMREKRCWICGETYGKFQAFCIGPMCAINRTTMDPPSHRDCAIFSAVACPFLNNPEAVRRTTNLPEDGKPAPGFGIQRNPGVALVWVTTESKAEKAFAGNPGFLFHLGPPTEVLWYARGREATRAEVLRSIETGYPSLMEMATAQSPEAVAELGRLYDVAMKLLPAA